MNSLSSEITTTQSDTNATVTLVGMTDYSDSVYSSMFPSMFSTSEDTATVLSITASSELSNITLSPPSTSIAAINYCFF